MTSRWNRFFYEPLDTLPLALCRIVHGVAALLTAAFLFPERFVWFGDRGLISLKTANAISIVPVTSLFHWVRDPEPWITPLLIAMMIAGTTLAIGFFTRTSAAIVFVLLMALHHRTPMILNGADVLLRINSLFLAFSHAGATLSVDHRLHPAQSAEQPPWAQRLMQLQLSVVYLGTVYWKLHGIAWIDGTAVYYVLSTAQFQHAGNGFFIPLVLSRIATWGTLIIEFASGSLIWIPRLRNVTIAAALLLHIGLEIAINVPLFQWLMIGSLLLFIDPADLRRTSARCPVPSAQRPAPSAQRPVPSDP
jgi:hypothetical protein